MEVLRVYASTSYYVDIESFTPLFTNLEELTVEEPHNTEVILSMVKKGVEIETVSKFQEPVQRES